MPLLGYVKWQKFYEVIKKGETACKLSGQPISNHFLPAPVKSTGGRPQNNYFLTRFACYLIAQNGDPRKPEIAIAQSYFATQTRKQELSQQINNENRRLEARSKLKETETKIESTVYTRGIKYPVEFATFKNKHIQALYGGLSINQLKESRKIPQNRSLADFDTQIELKAKDFALAMTDHNIHQKNLYGKPALNAEVVKNSQVTRKALLSRGIQPENLPSEEDIKQIESRRKTLIPLQK